MENAVTHRVIGVINCDNVKSYLTLSKHLLANIFLNIRSKYRNMGVSFTFMSQQSLKFKCPLGNI